MGFLDKIGKLIDGRDRAKGHKLGSGAESQSNKKTVSNPSQQSSSGSGTSPASSSSEVEAGKQSDSIGKSGTTNNSSLNKSSVTIPNRNTPQNQAANAAGAAAMARFQKQKANPSGRNNALFNQIRKEKRLQMERELVNEKKEKVIKAENSNNNNNRHDPSDPNCIYYPRPNADDARFVKMLEGDLIKQAVSNLYNENEKGVFEECVKILSMYFENIIKDPSETKYHNIKSSNKTFATKVGCVRGAENVFLKIGFSKNEESDGNIIYTFVDEVDDLKRAVTCMNSPPIPPMSRLPKLYLPSNKISDGWDVPDDFFKLTTSDIKSQQAELTRLKDQEMTMRTEAMRQMGKKTPKTYLHTHIRVKFPNHYVLQGIFYTHEKVKKLFDFILQQLDTQINIDELDKVIKLCCADKKTMVTMDEGNLNFKELQLTPRAVMTLNWNNGDISFKPTLLENSTPL